MTQRGRCALYEAIALNDIDQLVRVSEQVTGQGRP